MDPDKTLRLIREAMFLWETAPNDAQAQDHASELVDLVGALDDWMSKGGFLPASWERNR